MNITIKSKNGDISELARKLEILAHKLKETNILPLSLSFEDGSIRVNIKYLELAELAKNKDVEIYEMAKYQQIVYSYKGIEFFCNRRKKPQIRRIDPSLFSNKSWSIV